MVYIHRHRPIRLLWRAKSPPFPTPIIFDLNPPPLVEDPVRFNRSGVDYFGYFS
jgi:hypothetical protein